MKRFFVSFCCVLCFYIPKAQTSKHLYPSVFWEITGNGLKSPGYLFGTMHVSNKLVFHLSDSFYNAIQRCDQVALELNPVHWQPDMVQMDAAQVRMAAYLKNGNNDYITESSFTLDKYDDDLKAALTSQPMQINGLLYRTQAAQADYEENTYLDLYIYQTGRKLGKKPGGVEDYYETEKLVFEAYRDMAKDKNKKKPDTDGESDYSIQNKIQDAYRRGDLDLLDSLEGLMFSSPAYVEKFLYRRNEIQANSIDTILKKNTLFVGVGAAHLPGKRGVIELLRKKGYILRPIIMQDRDAARKDSIDKMKVPVAFRQVTTDDGMVTMQAPGALYRKNAGLQGGADGWQFADMDNGSYYMLTRIQTHAAMLGQTTDEVMKKIDSVLYENIPGKIIKKERITKSGYPGYDITNKTRRGDIQRYNIIATPYEILVFRMSGNDNYVDGSEANTFFNSIAIKAPAQGWQSWQSPSGGFSVMLPQQPNVCVNASGSDNINRLEFEAVDKNTGNAYMVWKKTVLNDDFLEEDPFDLSLVEQSFKKSDIISKQVSRGLTRQNGYAALDMQFSLKTGGFINARAILRGTQYYLLAERTSKTSKPDKRFLQSFAFTDAAYAPAEQFTDTLLHFTVNTPVRPQLDARLVNMYSQAMKDDDGTIEGLNSKPYWPRESSALFKSDSTGEAVQVNVKEFPVYYYSKDSAAFWKSRLNLKNDDSDLVLYSKQFITVNPACKGYKLVYRDTNTVRQIVQYVLLSGNRLYRLTAVGDSLQSGSSGFIPTFFNSFKPYDSKPGPSVFDNKLDTFFADFASKDSLLHQRAANAIPDVYFGPAGISRITKAIGSLTYTDKDYFDLKTKFIHELGFIDDSCCITQTVNALLDVYTKTADTSYFQNEALTALARLKTSQSWMALKGLLVQDPPVFDNQSEYSTLFSFFYDSLPLAKALFPDILQLSSIEDYKAPVTSLLRTMVDSGLVKAGDYEQYYSKLYFDARIQLKKQQNSDEKLLEKENSKEEDDDNTSTVNYNYRNLLRGKYRDFNYSNNNSSDIGIGDYAILLSPFYDTHPAVPKFFDRQLQSKDLSVQLDAAIVLLRNHKTVADSILLNIAAQNQYRAKLLKKLEEIQRTELFPAKYRNQDSVARALLLNDKSLPKFNDVACMGKQYVKLNKTEGYVYFYKYKLKKNDEWHLGLSGVQPLNNAQVSANDLLTKMTDKKFKTDTTEAEQFDEQLKKLIFQQHRSAQNFFEDDNDYSYLRRKYMMNN